MLGIKPGEVGLILSSLDVSNILVLSSISLAEDMLIFT